MAGFIETPSDWDATSLLSGPQVAATCDHNQGVVQAWLNAILSDESTIRVLAVTPIQSVTTSADEYGNVLPLWYASVLYRERLLPNGPEGGDE